MDAVIMCAGLGTRLQPLTDSMPKPLVPISGRSSLERILDSLPQEVDRIVLVIGYLGHMIQERIGSSLDRREVVYVRQDRLDGTGGALRRAEPFIKSEKFLVLNGDDLYDHDDMRDIMRTPMGVMYVRRTFDMPVDSWDIREDGKLIGLYRTGECEEARMNTGAYCLDRSWFDTDPVLVPGKDSEWGLPQAIPQLIERGHEVRALEARFWMPVGTPEQLEQAESILVVS